MSQTAEFPRLFVYGTLRPGNAPAAIAPLIAGCRVLGDATVAGRLYDLGAYPGLVLDDAAPPVHGVLLEFPTDPPWFTLDRYEGCDPADPGGALYCRVVTRVMLANAGGETDAWVYVYNHPVAEDRRIRSGHYQRERAMKRPVIGITMDTRDEPGGPGVGDYYQLASTYAQAVERAGGLPLALPYKTHHALIPQFVDLLDGVLFTGGNDLDPAAFNEPLHPKAVPVDPAREQFERALLAEVERRRTPALFVCMGCQLLNVARGGSLTQFIPDDAAKLEHRRGDVPVRRHDVNVDPESHLGRAIGRTTISANTYHKQAVNEVGKGLRVVATAPDGIIEGLEDPTFPMMVAVQWHPERLTDEDAHLAPFRLLVEKASKGL